MPLAPVTATKSLIIQCCATPSAVGEALLFRKQIFQVALRKAPRESFLAQHVGDRLRLALLQLPNLLLHCPRCNQPIRVDRPSLSDAMRSVDGLRFHGWIPPWIVEHDITC